MSGREIYLDISQLLLDPQRTGIQRAERELIRHWPGTPPIPCCFDPASQSLRVLPSRVLEAVCETGSADIGAERRRLARGARLGGVVRPGERVLNAELFFDHARAAYYQRHGTGAFWLLYDFLPWLDPQWFGTGAPLRLMPYLKACRTVEARAFISGRTREAYVRRVARHPDPGPVIPMGADGLGLEPQSWHPGRRSIVMLGSIEPRKNAVPAMQAFRTLRAEGHAIELTMIGHASRVFEEEVRMLRSLEGVPGFQHLENLPDAGVRDALRQARLVLFPSEGEGYGIPPMEALHAGIPVLVAASLPALDGVSPAGQIRLGQVDAGSIADGLRQVLDDTRAAALWREAQGLVVPGWRDFARDVAAWVRG